MECKVYVVFLFRVQSPSQPPQDSVCDTCKSVILLITPFIDSSKDEADVKNELLDICNMTTGNFAKEVCLRLNQWLVLMIGCQIYPDILSILCHTGDYLYT